MTFDLKAQPASISSAICGLRRIIIVFSFLFKLIKWKWKWNVLREGLHGLSWLVLHRDSSQATHNTVNPKQDVLFKKFAFEEIGVNQRSS